MLFFLVLLPGAIDGGASLLVVPSVVVLPGALGRIYADDHPGGHTQGSLVRRIVSRENRSCRASLMDAIALIINYLGVRLGIAFTG